MYGRLVIPTINISAQRNYPHNIIMWMKTKTKFPWGLEHPTSTVQESNIGGISPWPPPRSYTCSFCAREFPSAQALGGHMNIHRRDRARINSQPDHPPQPDDAVVLSKPILHTSNVLESYNTSKQAAGDCGDGSSKLLAGMNLNIVGMGDGDCEGIIICKKHKKNGVLSSTPLPLFRGKQTSKFGDEDMMIGSRSREGLDLELRLGINPPPRAVKLESINTNVSP